MPNETKSDEELASGFERILESEHQLRLVWVRATGGSYEDAVAAFEQAKSRAVTELVQVAVIKKTMDVLAATCRCDPHRFPEEQRLSLQASKGEHHYEGCPQYAKA